MTEPMSLVKLTREGEPIDNTLTQTTSSGMTALRWFDPANEVGSWSVEMLPEQATAIGLVDGQAVSMSVLDDDDNYVDAFSGVTEHVKRVTVAAGEHADVRVTWSGRGLISELEKAIVGPAQASPWATERRFDWAAVEVDAGTGWGDADYRGTQGARNLNNTTIPTGLAGLPLDYINPLAQWIWGQSVFAGPVDPTGPCYFHHTFELDDESIVWFAPLADDAYTLAVDGVVIMSSTDDTRPAVTHTVRPVQLPAGTHTVRAAVRNVDRSALGISNNVGQFCLTVYRLVETSTAWGTVTGPEWLLTTATAGWKAVAYPTVQPGLTVPEILDILLAEAQADNQAFEWTIVADGTFDPIPARLPVGSSLLDTLRTFADQGYIDFAADPTVMRQLNIWADRGTTTAAVVGFEDLTEYEEETDWAPVADRLLVAYNGGFTGVGDPDGHSVRYLTVDAETELEAQTIAASQLGQINEPITVVSAAWDAGSDTVAPYIGFNVADTIEIAGSDDVVTSISYRLDDNGHDWSVEVHNQRTETVQRQERMLARTSPGLLRGRGESSAPVTPRQPEARTIRTGTLTFSADVGAPEGSEASPITVPGPASIVRAEMHARDAGGSTTRWVLNLAGVDTLWDFELGTGETFAEWSGLVIFVDQNTAISRTVDADGGHTGVTLELTFALLP